MEGTTAVNPPSNPWGAKSQPWGSVQGPAMPTAFEDVMSEELVRQMNDEQWPTPQKQTSAPAPVAAAAEPGLSQFLTEENPEADSDFLLAQMLQHEFDKEHDAMLQSDESKVNANRHVKVSYERYRHAHPSYDEQEPQEEEDWEEDEYEAPEQKPNFKRGGVSGKGKDMISKHDATICGKKNAKKVLDRFPPEFDTGDCDAIDMKLSNQVYNKLKMHSETESKRATRVHEKKEHATAEQAVDEKTRLIMYKLVNNGVLDNVNGIVSTGKESVIFHADGGTMTEMMVPKECVLKVFKTTLADFKNRCQYVKGDVRFFKDEFKKQNPRKILRIWAEKEMMNLKMIAKAGVKTPTPILLKKHVLLMSFIGRDQVAAPKLKDAKLGTADLQIAYEQCVEYMKKMYDGCKLVHADLSEYNMLWHDDNLYFIDVAQSVERMHPYAMEFLLRDCANVVDFFGRAGVHDVPTQYQLFNEITGLDLVGEGEDFLAQIEEYEKDEDRMRQGTSNKDYPFDYFFDLAEKEREERKKKNQLGEEHDSTDSDDSDLDEKYDSVKHQSSPSSKKSPSGKKSPRGRTNRKYVAKSS